MCGGSWRTSPTMNRHREREWGVFVLFTVFSVTAMFVGLYAVMHAAAMIGVVTWAIAILCGQCAIDAYRGQYYR